MVLWQEEARRNTRRSKSGKHLRSNEATRNEVLAVKKPSAGPGRRLTNRTAVAVRRAEEDAEKSEANQVLAKAEGKAVGDELSGTILQGQTQTKADSSRIDVTRLRRCLRLDVRPGLSCMFATGASLLVLTRLQFLFLGHNPPQPVDATRGNISTSTFARTSGFFRGGRSRCRGASLRCSLCVS